MSTHAEKAIRQEIAQWFIDYHMLAISGIGLGWTGDCSSHLSIVVPALSQQGPPCASSEHQQRSQRIRPIDRYLLLTKPRLFTNRVCAAVQTGALMRSALPVHSTGKKWTAVSGSIPDRLLLGCESRFGKLGRSPGQVRGKLLPLTTYHRTGLDHWVWTCGGVTRPIWPLAPGSITHVSWWQEKWREKTRPEDA